MPDLKLKEHTISRPVSYRFVFDDPQAWQGWAILTINEDTGEVHIQSDYGNYQHRWTPAHTGEKGPRAMHRFFARASAGYLVEKFGYGGQPDLKRVVDTDRVKRELRAAIIAARRGRYSDSLRDWPERIDSYAARELWDQLESWCNEDCNIDRTPPELDTFLGHEPWHFVHETTSARHDFLTDCLIPFLQKWIRQNVLANGEAVAHA